MDRRINENTLSTTIKKFKQISSDLIDDASNGDEFTKLMAFTRITNFLMIQERLDLILMLSMNTGMIAVNIGKEQNSHDDAKSWSDNAESPVHPMYHTSNILKDEDNDIGMSSKKELLRLLLEILKKAKKE